MPGQAGAMKKPFLFLSIIAVVATAHAQVKTTKTRYNIKPIRETVMQIQARESFMRFLGPPTAPKDNETEHEFERSQLRQHPGSRAVSTWPPQSAERRDSSLDKIDRGDSGPFFATLTNIGGPTSSEVPWVPPDTTGDVSLSSVIIGLNGRFRSYTRAGGVGTMNVTSDTFFATVRSGSTVDPRVVFDRLSGRWFLSAIDTTSTNNRLVLAVSDGEAITATTVWTFFQFNEGTGRFLDYDTLAVDATGVYVGGNIFGGAFNTTLYCIDKSLLLAGVLQVTAFRDLIDSSGVGIYTPWVCTNDDPSQMTSLVIGVDSLNAGALSYRRVSYSAGTFSISPNSVLPVPTTASPLNAPYPAGASTVGTISAVDDRLFYGRVFRDRTTNARVAMLAHNIRMGSDGVGNPAGDRTGARWYKLQNLFSGTLTLAQSGTVYNNALSSWFYLVMPSIAMNGQGNMFAGFTMSRSTTSPSIGGAYRKPTDSLLTAPTMINAGANYYRTGTTANQRWGDYSVTVVDPRDMQTFWTFQEYCNANGSYQVRAIEVVGDPPTITGFFPIAASPGSNVTVTITGTGIFDPGTGYPDRLAVNFGTNITVNSVTWVNATTANVNISLAANATTGSRTITLTNPDGQTATGQFQVNTPVTYTGVINSYGINVSTEPYTFELRNSTTNALMDVKTATPNATGNFSFTSAITGSFKLSAKTRKRLSDSQAMNPTITANLRSMPGDANNDDRVNLSDFSKLSLYYGKRSTDSGWSTPDADGVAPMHCDWTNDGVVNLADFSLLSTYYGRVGNP